MVNFLASLFASQYRVNTIASHVSALSYINKLFGHADLGHSFLAKQFLKGATNIFAHDIQSDSRLPITYSLLKQIVLALPNTILNYVDRILFSAMCILAFNGFLRIGEICVKSPKGFSNVVMHNDLHLVTSEHGCIGIELKLRHFKHSKQAVTLFMPVNSHDPVVCPVKAIYTYLATTSHATGPLFQASCYVFFL